MNEADIAKLKEALEAARANVNASAAAYSACADAHEASPTVDGTAYDKATAALAASVARLKVARAAYDAVRKDHRLSAM